MTGKTCYFAAMDVVDLRNFYAQRLGTVARRFVSRGIRARWPDTSALRVLGIGYATPYLGLFREEAERCLAMMPAPQGVVRWPSSRPALAALVEEDDLPLTDSAVDRVLLVHALEASSDPVGLLREVWRVLSGGGRLLAVVPNRRGLWARMDTTPFGYGRPYSRSQITHLLARDLVHADRMGRGALRAANRPRLVSAFGGGLGAHRGDALGAVRRRAHRRGDEAGLSRDPGPARAAPFRAVAAAGARPSARRRRAVCARPVRQTGHGSLVTAAASAPTSSPRLSRRARARAAMSAALISATRLSPRNTSPE